MQRALHMHILSQRQLQVRFDETRRQLLTLMQQRDSLCASRPQIGSPAPGALPGVPSASVTVAEPAAAGEMRL